MKGSLGKCYYCGFKQKTRSRKRGNAVINPNVDYLEVVHFHGAQQCGSCIIVWGYAKSTLFL
ncbi:MAG: hypothetical protein PHW96_01955 [Candidatus Nanoarchaeia archaeon]|nr:hypothetical protein [Candidatus Nanoarchaeia archaeon]